MTFACVLKQNLSHLRHWRLFEKAFQQPVSYSNIHFSEVFFYARGSLTKKVLLSKVVTHFIFLLWWTLITQVMTKHLGCVGVILIKQPVLWILKRNISWKIWKSDWKPHRLLKINKDFLFKIILWIISDLKLCKRSKFIRGCDKCCHLNGRGKNDIISLINWN